MRKLEVGSKALGPYGLGSKSGKVTKDKIFALVRMFIPTYRMFILFTNQWSCCTKIWGQTILPSFSLSAFYSSGEKIAGARIFVDII